MSKATQRLSKSASPQPAETEPRVLLLDIEVTPNVGTFWGLHIQSGYIDPENILSERYIVCAAWKWLGEPTVYSADVLANPGKKKDGGVLRKLHGAMSRADLIVAHNGDKFDLPWILTRMAIGGMKPPPPVPTVDTKKVAKRLYFNSAKLDYLGKVMELGRKIPTTSELWTRVRNGDRKAVAEMVAYNKQDVLLLEKVYLRLQPYVPAKLNRTHWSSDQRTCPSCGAQALQSRGVERRRVSVAHRFQCRACGAWCSRPKNSTVVR